MDGKVQNLHFQEATSTTCSNLTFPPLLKSTVVVPQNFDIHTIVLNDYRMVILWYFWCFFVGAIPFVSLISIYLRNLKG